MAAASKPLGIPEFVSMLALMVSLLALSIDGMLPALGEIAQDLRLSDPNDAQLVVTAMFFGFAAGQIVAGPLSDNLGRKPVIYGGYVIFIAGCLLSIAADSFAMMLAGRVLQGLGAAAPRIVSIALVRDGYEGRAMARIMSIVMAIFILVPAIAPAIGQVVMLILDWRAIFWLFLAIAIIAFAWFAIRQPETLASAARRRFSFNQIAVGIKEALGYRAMTGYTLAAGIIFGAFVGYLSSAQQLFQSAYQTGDWFSVYFGCAALSIGAASIVNSKLVIGLGMRYLTWRALIGLTALSCLFVPAVLAGDGLPPLWAFMVWLLLAFFCTGILFGNFNALAMEPVGHMAGLGAAVIGSVSTLVSLPLGWAIGAAFDGTVVPLVVGFAVLGGASLIVMWWTERGAIPA
ncbi:multidrug effflux MFS transporter [Pelagibius sp. Alg239-R121]|uniref:multidrug effflux MFS transporter n=1 Tax=Pelagibius sp. Alg239-R121 TaxID=2993448 RepID=UPI0024A631DA|nr:multidrug effflux MFS transporter [Pelagibius sp. Alg239-R121]